jgi:hypothetical protein
MAPQPTTTTTAVAVTTTAVTTPGRSNAGAIAGGVAGGVVGLGVIVVAVLWILRKRKKSQPLSERDLLSGGGNTTPYSLPTAPAQDTRLAPTVQVGSFSACLQLEFDNRTDARRIAILTTSPVWGVVSSTAGDV